MKDREIKCPKDDGSTDKAKKTPDKNRYWEIVDNTSLVLKDSLGQKVESVVISGSDWITGEIFAQVEECNEERPTVIRMVGKKKGLADVFCQVLVEFEKRIVGEVDSEEDDQYHEEVQSEYTGSKEIHIIYDDEGRISNIVRFTKEGSILINGIQRECYFPEERQEFHYDNQGRIITKVEYMLDEEAGDNINEASLFIYEEVREGITRSIEVSYNSWGLSKDFREKFPQTKGIACLESVYVVDLDSQTKKDLGRSVYHIVGSPPLTRDQRVQRYPLTAPLKAEDYLNSGNTTEFPQVLQFPTFLKPVNIEEFKVTGEIPSVQEQLIYPDRQFILADEALTMIKSIDGKALTELIVALFEDDIVVSRGFHGAFTPYEGKDGFLKLREKVMSLNYSNEQKLALLLIELQHYKWNSRIKEMWSTGISCKRYSLEEEMIRDACMAFFDIDLVTLQHVAAQMAEQEDLEAETSISFDGVLELVEAFNPLYAQFDSF